MRFWLPTLVGLFAALFIARTDPGAPGMMTGLLTSLTGLDIAIRLDK